MTTRSRKRLATIAATTVIVATLCPGPATATPKPRQEQWWFNTWNITSNVWPLTQGQGVTVAVIDSGVNAKLPDLKGTTLKGTETSGSRSDGRTDYDTRLGGHGTAMASLIVSRGSSTGIAGVAPKALVLPVTWSRPKPVDTIDAMSRGIEYAARHGAKIINISAVTGGEAPTEKCALQESIDYAVKRDVVIVAGSGNDGQSKWENQPIEPARCPGVIAIGGIRQNLEPWAETQRQPYIALAAPAEDISSIGRAGRIRRASGTSAATALTSAVVALVRSKYPDMPAREVVRRLIATAKDVGEPGVDDRSGYGLVRPYEAITAKVAASTPNPVYERWDKLQAGKSQPTGVPAGSRPALPGEKTAANEGSEGETSLGLVAALGAAGLVGAIISAVIVVARRRRAARP